MLANAYSLSGNVKTDAQKVLPFASVYVKDALKGATTGLDGNYVIKGVPAGRHTLVVSYMGYKTQTMEIDIEGDMTRNFVMEEQAITLDDVFVTPTGESLERFILSQVVSHRKKLSEVMNSFTCQELYRLEQRNNKMKVLVEPHIKTFDFALGILGLRGFLHVLMDHPDLKVEMSSMIQMENGKVRFYDQEMSYNDANLTEEEVKSFTKLYVKKTDYRYESYYDNIADIRKKLMKMDKKDAEEAAKKLSYCGSYDENGKVVHIVQYYRRQFHIVDGCWQLRRTVLLKENKKEASENTEFYELADNVYLPISSYREGNLSMTKMLKEELDDLKKEDTASMSAKRLQSHNARMQQLEDATKGDADTYKVSCALTYTQFKVKQ